MCSVLFEHRLGKWLFTLHQELLCAGKLSETQKPAQKGTGVSRLGGAVTGERRLKLAVWCNVCANHTFKESKDIKA